MDRMALGYYTWNGRLIHGVLAEFTGNSTQDEGRRRPAICTGDDEPNRVRGIGARYCESNQQLITEFIESMKKAEMRAGSMLAKMVKESAEKMREGLQGDIHIAGLKAREYVHEVNEAHRRPAIIRWGWWLPRRSSPQACSLGRVSTGRPEGTFGRAVTRGR